MRVLSPRERIAKARIQLLIEHPFFGCLAMRLLPQELKPEEAVKYGIKAMAVDIYGNLIYNPEWVSRQSDAVLKAAVAHEVLHLAFKHFLRQGSRSRMLWNIATDAAINDILEESFTVPQEWVHIPEMRDKSAEEIYDYLVKHCKKGDGQGYGIQFDTHFYGGDSAASDKERSGMCQGDYVTQGDSPFRKPDQEPFDAEGAVKEAWNFAKHQGRLPGGLEKWFRDLLEPTINWKDYLKRLIVSILPHDFSYTAPHKKSQALGYYIPMVKKETVQIVAAVDTSGSISDKEYLEFISEVQGICKQFDSVKGWLILCDADIQGVYEIKETFDPLSFPRRGYGGTSAIPVYKWITQNLKQEDVKLLIYFTDGYIELPNEEYPFHTLWVLSSNGTDEYVKKYPNSTVIKMPGRRGE